MVMDEAWAFGKAALRCARQAACDEPPRYEPRQSSCLLKAAVREGDLVVDEIPVRTADETYVRLEDEHSTAGAQDRVCHPQLFDKPRLMAGARGSCS